MNPRHIVFPPNIDLRAPREPADVILFPRVRGLFADLIKSWRDRGYDVSCNLNGNMVAKPRASRATVFFNKIRRNHGAK